MVWRVKGEYLISGKEFATIQDMVIHILTKTTYDGLEELELKKIDNGKYILRLKTNKEDIELSIEWNEEVYVSEGC